MYSIEEFDQAKTKVLKYILYKKRTENEIRRKFENYFDSELFEDTIDYLKEAGYINDVDYLNKAINNMMILKNLSIIELRYKLITKGLNKNLIEDYFYENKEKLTEFEIKSASNIILKKKNDMDFNELKLYLMKKGYRQDTIKTAFEENE